MIPEGRQLDDIQDIRTNAVTDGIFTLISNATCVNLDGQRHCVSVADLRQAAGTAAPSTLSVPDWAANAVKALGNDHRRLEGLIAPGTWNIDPSGSPQQILSTLIGASATLYAQGGLLDTANVAEHVAVSDPDRGVVGAARGQAAGLREGRARHLQPAGRTPHAGVRLHGELPTGSPGGGDHRRRPGAERRRGIPMCAKGFRPRRSARPGSRR